VGDHDQIPSRQAAAALASDVAAAIVAQGFAQLPIMVAHAQLAGALAGESRDPFDRMLIAQALVERMTLVSNEVGFDSYGVNRLW
jgi:PIN domain nuclease of toxin-antitoxin system